MRCDAAGIGGLAGRDRFTYQSVRQVELIARHAESEAKWGEIEMSPKKGTCRHVQRVTESARPQRTCASALRLGLV
jgi:hypothetical protein